MERVIEFEANGAESALTAMERHCEGREAQVFENGRSLGRVSNERVGGFWLLTRAYPEPELAA